MQWQCSAKSLHVHLFVCRQQQTIITNMATITVTKVGSKRKAAYRDGKKTLKNSLGKINLTASLMRITLHPTYYMINIHITFEFARYSTNGHFLAVWWYPVVCKCTSMRRLKTNDKLFRAFSWCTLSIYCILGYSYLLTYACMHANGDLSISGQPC